MCWWKWAMMMMSTRVQIFFKPTWVCITSFSRRCGWYRIGKSYFSFIFFCTFSPSQGYFWVFVEKKIANGEKGITWWKKEAKKSKNKSKGLFFLIMCSLCSSKFLLFFIFASFFLIICPFSQKNPWRFLVSTRCLHQQFTECRLTIRHRIYTTSAEFRHSKGHCLNPTWNRQTSDSTTLSIRHKTSTSPRAVTHQKFRCEGLCNMSMTTLQMVLCLRPKLSLDICALRHHLQKPFRGTSGLPLKRMANFCWGQMAKKKPRNSDLIFSFASFFDNLPLFFRQNSKRHFWNTYP